jgi:hypothetical protein
MIQLIDRAAGSDLLRWFDPSRLGRSLTGRRRHLAYIMVWAIVFAVMSAVQGVGDRHPGQFVPFWQQACQRDRPDACRYLASMHANFCRQGSRWACNELNRLTTGSVTAKTSSPTLEDYPIILRGSKAPITDRTPSALYALACSQGWPDTCGHALSFDTSTVGAYKKIH